MKKSWQNAIATIRRSVIKGQVITFGADDRLPNRIVEDVNDSGTALTCISRIKRFIVAKGFVDQEVTINERGQGLVTEKMGKIKVNPSQTANELLNDLAMNQAYMESIVLRVTFTRDGEIGNVYCEPVTSIRRLTDLETYRYNRYYGYDSGYLKSQNKDLPDFNLYAGNSEEVKGLRRQLVKDQIKKYGKVWGCILYKFEKRLGQGYDDYGVPAYFSGIADIRADANLSRVELGNVMNGFRAQVIIATPKIDRVTKDENGKTPYDYFSETLTNFIGPQGDTILHLEGDDPAHMPQVTIINPADMMDGIEKARERVPKAVCRHFGVPPVLCGLETAGKLGLTKEMQDQMRLFYMEIENRRMMILEAFNLIWPDVPWKIQDFDFFKDDNQSESTAADGGVQ